MKQFIFILFAVLIGIGSLGLGIYTSSSREGVAVDEHIAGLLWPNPKQLQPFTMQDHTGQQFGLTRLSGKWSFLFFGYTHCPDVCPITLSVMNHAYQQMQRQHPDKEMQVIFVSVDPERDGQQALSRYVHYFNPEFIGLGGTMGQMNSLVQQLGVPYYHSAPDEQGGYMVEHSASIFLLDQQARLVAILSGPHRQQDIVTRFNEISRFIIKQG